MIFVELLLSRAPGGCWIILLWAWLLVDHHGVAWCCSRLSLRKQYQVCHSLASLLEGATNGHYLFLYYRLFLGTVVFRLLLVLLRSSLSLLQEVCYLLLPEFCHDCPSVGICRSPSSWRTSVTSLTGLKSPPGLSNAYTYWYDARGPSGTYSTCSCLFFLLGC